MDTTSPGGMWWRKRLLLAALVLGVPQNLDPGLMERRPSELFAVRIGFESSPARFLSSRIEIEHSRALILRSRAAILETRALGKPSRASGNANFPFGCVPEAPGALFFGPGALESRRGGVQQRRERNSAVRAAGWGCGSLTGCYLSGRAFLGASYHPERVSRKPPLSRLAMNRRARNRAP